MSDRGPLDGDADGVPRDPGPRAGDPAAAGDLADAADLRMAELLSKTSSNAELRRELRGDHSAEADDLLGRLNVLDFVGSVVGESVDMPERLGDYKITGLLGRGGMGTVYLAFQEQLEREVALKVLSSSWTSDPTMRRRFRAEARATASLHHRHIVPIYDYGEAQGCMFFAMERVHGQSLDRHIAAARRVGKRPMDPMDAARRFAGVADALGLAHRRRILHRDVKPGNILVGDDGTLALTDFGLAKALDQGSMNLTSKSGGFLGTLHYSPPEQALGRELSPASDLYALGVTMFETVSGRLPILGKTTEAVLQSILHGAPLRLKDVMPRPPRDLGAVLEKLLSREPQDRYQDGEELARDLQRIADGDPVHIRRQPIVLRLYRRARKNPLLSGAFIAAFVLLVVTFFLFGAVKRERGQTRQSRHQTELMEVANRVREDMGWPSGPGRMLRCLCGGAPLAARVPNASVLEDLRRAHEEFPEDEMVERMRRAYVEDPLPAASEQLAAGRGNVALELYEEAIHAALQRRSFLDHSVEMQLYGLYLGRAVAHLTAAVAKPGNARRDLDLASFLRPGAVFPLALASILDIAEDPDPAAAVRRLEARLQSAAEERRVVVGRLLWAMARVRPSGSSQLMPFQLPHGVRMAVHRLAARWIDAPPADVVEEGSPTGFAADLQALAIQARESLGNSVRLRELGQRVAEHSRAALHHDSPLQGWHGAMQLLERPRASTALVDVDGAALAPRLELAAWDALLSTSPPRPWLSLLSDRFEAFYRAHLGLAGLDRTAALFHTAVLSSQAMDLVDAWLVEQPEEPEALRARMTLHLRDANVGAALDAAMALAQQSADRAAVLGMIADSFTAAADTAPSDAGQELLAFARSFRDLLP